MVDALNVASGTITSYNGVAPSQANCNTPNLPPGALGGAPPIYLGIILSGPNGMLWYSIFCNGGQPATFGYGGFNQMNTSGVITSNVSDSYNPPEILDATVGSDGNVWPTEQTPYGPFIASCPYHPNTSIYGITAGPDGALWLPGNNISPSTGAVLLRVTTACSVTTAATVSTSVDDRSIASAGGALWVIDIGANAIDKFTTAGSRTSYKVAKAWTVDGFGDAGYIAASPNGAYVYFDNTSGSQIGRVNVSTGQSVEYTVQSGGVTFKPEMLAVDAAGNVWTYQGSTILKVTFP